MEGLGSGHYDNLRCVLTVALTNLVGGRACSSRVGFSIEDTREHSIRFAVHRIVWESATMD